MRLNSQTLHLVQSHRFVLYFSLLTWRRRKCLWFVFCLNKETSRALMPFSKRRCQFKTCGQSCYFNEDNSESDFLGVKGYFPGTWQQRLKCRDPTSLLGQWRSWHRQLTAQQGICFPAAAGGRGVPPTPQLAEISFSSSSSLRSFQYQAWNSIS